MKDKPYLRQNGNCRNSKSLKPSWPFLRIYLYFLSYPIFACRSSLLPAYLKQTSTSQFKKQLFKNGCISTFNITPHFSEIKVDHEQSYDKSLYEFDCYHITPYSLPWETKPFSTIVLQSRPVKGRGDHLPQMGQNGYLSDGTTQYSTVIAGRKQFLTDTFDRLRNIIS